MSDALTTTLAGVKLKNPVIAASGTFGFGAEYARLIDVSRLGAISCKGLTLKGSRGNEGERVYETASGLLNSIGLENPGVRHFVSSECHSMRKLGCAVMINLGGHSCEDYEEGARLLNDADADLLELNISCPNVKEGGMAFGMDPSSAAHITKLVKGISRFPVIVKLTPNAPDIVAVAKACEAAGADGISLVNTFLGMAIDVKRKKPVFNNVYAGLSGPCIMPIALRMTHQTAHAVSIPVVGMGGISTAEDALAFIMAGAAAVEIGSATFSRPDAALRVIDGLEQYASVEGLRNIADIRGII